jgi:TonB family protein
MKRILLFIILAFFMHLPLLAIQISFDVPKPNKKHIIVSLTKVPKLTREQKPKKEEPEEEELTGQVVDLPPDNNAEKPDHADFLSETNHKTERETVSRHRSLSDEQSGHERTVADDVEDSATSLGTNEKMQSELHKKEIPKVNERERLSFKLENDGRLKNDSGSNVLSGTGKSLQLGPDSEDAEHSDEGAKEIILFPDQRTLAKISSAPFSDAVEDVEEGEGTFLNTLAFKHAGFFNRVKRNIVNFWHPLPEIRRRDPTGNIYGVRDRKTLLTVTLDSEGNILDLSISETCGVDFMDQEAIRAFRRARQFPNPPKGLIKNGKVRFDFGFSISFSKPGGFF